jgi:hypothetical protein
VAATKRTLTARLSAAALPAAATPPAPALTACRMLLRDAHLTDAGGLDALALVVEHKNEMQGGDLYFQLQRTYGMFWEADCRADSALRCLDCCPALAVELVGPLLRVSALASLHANRVLCEPLTQFLPVLELRDQPEAMARLVVTLRARRTAVQRLRAHYAERGAAAAAALPPAPGRGRDAALARPHPLRNAARFSHVTPLCDDKLLYAARDGTRAGDLVCVKFSRRGYGDGVHRAWADAGAAGTGARAPALHELRPLPGGLTMVVMELLPRTAGWRMLREVAAADADVAWAAASAALADVHARPLPGGGYGAHGDCRAVNVLVRPRADACAGGWDVRFVDFDGAGAEGGRLYPPFMSPAVQWPVGALPGLPLQRAHDAELLERNRS